MISIKRASPFQKDISALIDELDRYQESLYPAASNHLDSRETLSQPNCLFISAHEGETVCGIGAVKLFKDYGEIKRVYVSPSARGKGVAGIIVRELEEFLKKNALKISRLETGIHQTEAIHFYRKLGYVEIPPFGEYKPDPLSLFMEKLI